jgi:hypothetical protein
MSKSLQSLKGCGSMAEIPMGSQLYIGKGVDSDTGQVFGCAIDFDSVQSAGPGQIVSLRLESISSSREMAETLNVKASASITAGWGASAEFSMTQSKEVNSYYTYALVRVVVKNPAQTLRNPRLRPQAQTLLEQHGWNAFADAYGWEYVDGFISGGSYYALLEIQTSSQKEQDAVKAKLSGFYGPFSASAEFQQSLKDIAKTTVINVSVTRTGGSGQMVATDLDGMLREATSFPATALAAPVPVIALTAEYQHTVPLPDVPPPDSLPRTQQRETLHDLGVAYLALRDYRANLQFVLAHLAEFDEFRGMQPPELQQKRAEYQTSLEQVAQELDRIVELATKCAADYIHCQTYVPQVVPQPLPTIGGELMNLKQMEEKLNAVEALVAGRLQPSGDVRLSAGRLISAPGRLNISGDELLFLLNRSGVVIGKEWGGNGNLTVEGDVCVNGGLKVAGRGAPTMTQMGVAPQVALTPNGTQDYRVNVRFAEPFSSPPQVITAIQSIDANQAKGVRIDVIAENVTATGFTLRYNKWADTIINEVRAIWVACGVP